MKDLDAFRQSLTGSVPPEGSNLALEAIWWAGKGDWDRAHGTVQQNEGDPDCDLVHAHLHRQEGDVENARSWYAASGEAFPDIPLDEEWGAITTRMLSRQHRR